MNNENDNQEELISIIEILNSEIIRKKEKQIKNKKKMLLNAIKSGNLLYAIKKLFKKNNKKTVNFVENIVTTNVSNKNNARIAIYTCITGKYDNSKEPYIKESNCDYFLFTNNEKIKSSNWQIKSIPSNISSLNNNILINRYMKMHPYELFKDDYDYAIYIDGNITIVSRLSAFIEKCTDKTGLAFHKHYNKDCVYDEIKTCQIVGKGNIRKLKQQKENYKRQGFPEHFGLFECNVIVSDMKNDKGREILEYWWKEFNESGSYRDQICLPYVIWKNNIDINDIGIIENNVFLNSKIRINKHNK